MPPVPSLTKAFSALAKPVAGTAPRSYTSLSPAPAPTAAGPARPNLFSSIGGFLSGAYQKGQQMLTQPRSSVPRAGVSSPSMLAGVAAAPIFGSTQAPNATSVATGRPTYIAPAVPEPTPNATSVVTKQPVYGPNAPAAPIPNATSVATGKPVYGPDAPAIPQPKAPQTFAEPIIAPSGAKVDPNTGGVTAPAPVLPQAPAAPVAIANTGNVAGATDYSSAAGGAPGVGGPGGAPTVPSLEDEYLKSLRATKEEEDAQARLDELAGAAALSEANIQNQPIAMPFITGQLAAVERSKAARTVPIAAQLARLQAKRQMSLDFSKAALEREDKKAEGNKPVVVGEKASLVDPRTGKVVFGGAAATAAPQTDSWSSLIKTGQASLSDVPADMRSAVAEALASSPEISKKGKDAISQATVVMDYIDQADGQISGLTTGIVGVGSAMIPGTPAYNLARTIDTIKANVGFQALQAMRDASPTGGALGQVSEQENRLLQATLGSLDIGQGEEQLRANMAKVRQHFSNLVAILSAGPGANATIGEDGKVVITGGKGGATADVASEGWF